MHFKLLQVMRNKSRYNIVGNFVEAMLKTNNALNFTVLGDDYSTLVKKKVIIYVK